MLLRQEFAKILSVAYNIFDPTAIEPLSYNQSGNTVNWHFALQLKHGEAAP